MVKSRCPLSTSTGGFHDNDCVDESNFVSEKLVLKENCHFMLFLLCLKLKLFGREIHNALQQKQLEHKHTLCDYC